MPTYPTSPNITVDSLLQQPRTLVRDLATMTNQRFVADRIFTRGSADQVAGGEARYQKAESIFPTDGAEPVGLRSDFPRTSWTEAIFTAAVEKYGLEVPISYESQRRNQLDQIQRAQIKLGNALIRFVDSTAMTLLLNDAAVQTADGGNWSSASNDDIVVGIATAMTNIVNINEGYTPDTILLHPNQALQVLKNIPLRNALPRESQVAPAVTGQLPSLLGLNPIVTPNIPDGTAIVLTSKIVGTIADEAPGPREGYVSFSGGAGFPSVYLKVYTEDNDTYVIRVARWPAMWIAEPKSAHLLTALNT